MTYWTDIWDMGRAFWCPIKVQVQLPLPETDVTQYKMADGSVNCHYTWIGHQKRSQYYFYFNCTPGAIWKYIQRDPFVHYQIKYICIYGFWPNCTELFTGRNALWCSYLSTNLHIRVPPGPRLNIKTVCPGKAAPTIRMTLSYLVTQYAADLRQHYLR